MGSALTAMLDIQVMKCSQKNNSDVKIIQAYNKIKTQRNFEDQLISNIALLNEKMFMPEPLAPAA